MITRIRKSPFFLSLVVTCLAGCSGLDWNWDTSWWEKPRRVVKPTALPAQAPVARHTETMPAPIDEPENQEVAVVSPVPSAPHASSDVPPAARAYYQLYLVSSAKKVAENRGEYTAHITGASAYSAAGLLEMLYVPVGRSGSREECYLLFENASEFNAAVQFAKMLAAHQGPADISSLAPELEKPVKSYYQLVERGPVVERAQIEKCILDWSGVTFATLPELQRWAASIVTGKLFADYQYDYSRARDFYERAAQSVPEGSLEKKAAMWWIAESYALEGRRDEAIGAYEKILSIYGEKEENTQIVRRCEASIDRLKKR
jgi:tetratricopeptide (TPR) repeat protein